MNIAYILHSTCANDGATKAFLNMMDGMTPYGVKPYIVVPDNDGVFDELNKRQIPTLAVNYRSSAYPHSKTLKQRLLFLLRLAARIIVNQRATKVVTAWIRENKIDIVHSNSSIIRIGFDAAQKAGIPHVYHIREYADQIGVRYFPTKLSFTNQLECSQSYSICITKAIQRHYRQDNKESMSRVIYDGVFSKIDVMPKCDTKDYFLFAGRIQPAKGLDQLLNAYKLYVEKISNPLPLKVAGGSADEAYYRKQQRYVEENHLTDLVDFLGNRNDISELMVKARALIVSSPFEGFGFCMPEAMQQGCLVIGRNTSGTKEQLDNALTMTGKEIALRYETDQQLANLMTEITNHDFSFYDNYTRLAFYIVNQLYTKETNAKKIYALYNDILHRNSIVTNT
jgi:glycosyltransferase involved in cell wall biosynthesis